MRIKHDVASALNHKSNELVTKTRLEQRLLKVCQVNLSSPQSVSDCFKTPKRSHVYSRVHKLLLTTRYELELQHRRTRKSY